MDLKLPILPAGDPCVRNPGAFPPHAPATSGNLEEPAMRTLLAQRFTVEEVPAIRHAVAREATACGLTGPRLDDFVLAVHESVINAVSHAGGRGHVRLWTVAGVLRAETVDRGSGIPGGYLNGHHLPGETASDGRGIFLIRELCDDVVFSTGPQGTRVEITMRLPRCRRPLSPMRRVRVTAPRPGRNFIA